MEVKIYEAKVIAATERGSARALYRAAGYIRKVMKHSIRQAPYGKASAPGNPPKAHSRRFPASILFSMAPDRSYAIIGPTRLSDRPANPAGVPVSGVMERGGLPAPNPEERGSFLFRGAPPVYSENDLAAYLATRRSLPMFVGESEGEVRRQARGRITVRPMWSPKYKKMLYVGYVGNHGRGAREAASIMVANFGLDADPVRAIAPRPYAFPALQRAVAGGRVARFFRDVV